MTQLQQALHPGAPTGLPGAFGQSMARQAGNSFPAASQQLSSSFPAATQAAASRFPLDASSPLQLRDLRVPANRTLPGASAAASPRQVFTAGPGAQEGRTWSATEDSMGLSRDEGGRAEGSGSASSSSSSGGGGGGGGASSATAWHDAAERWEQANVLSDSGSSTQAAVWLRSTGSPPQQQHTAVADDGIGKQGG